MLKPSPVLDAREQRWLKKKERGAALRANFSCERFAVATCTLRMPASLRLSGLYNEIPIFFQEKLLTALRIALDSKSIQEVETGIDPYPDGPSAWIAAGCSTAMLKRLAIELEQSHPLGALIDIDISDAEGTLLSRRDLGIAPRHCLVCGEDAAVCVASQRHSLDEIEARVRAIAGKRALREELR